MANDIALLNQNDEEDELEANLSLDDLEKLLDDQVDQSFRDLDYLEEEKKSIDSPEKLGEVIGNVIWDQVITQIGVTAGEDFIAENRGLHLDLRKSAHIQTTENFNIDPQKAKIATHNEFIDYQKRYDDWQDNFKKDTELGYKTRTFRYTDTQQVWEKYDTRSDSWKKVLKNGARFDFDKGRPTGNNTANTSMDHIVSVGEIIRDPEANAHMSREEQIAFANSEKNLNLIRGFCGLIEALVFVHLKYFLATVLNYFLSRSPIFTRFSNH